jgi:putative transferase (TIGR04331 family)
MRRLCLTSIPDDFNSKNDILLGPWCLIGKEEKYPNWEDKFVFEPDPFSSLEEMALNSERTINFAEIYLYKLSDLLNKINETDYSVKFWRLLVFPWLLALTQTTWERQIRIEKFLDRYKGESFEVDLVINNINWNFKDTLDHQISGLFTDEYNHWLYSRLLEKRIPKDWKINWVEKAPHKNVYGQNKTGLKHRIGVYLSSKFLSSTVYGVNMKTAVVFDFILKIKSLTKLRNNRIQTQKNSNIADLEWYLNFDELVKVTLPKFFTDLRNINLPKIHKNKIFLVGPVLYVNDETKLKLALHKEKRGKIITTQHGGGYGVRYFSSSKLPLEYSQYKFFSWGWQKQCNYRISTVALPSPMLSKLKYKKQNDKIVFVGQVANLYSYRLSQTPQALKQIEYRQAKSKFIENLNQDTYSKLYYRPSLHELGSLADKSYIQNKFPSLKIISDNFHDELFACKLVVLDHPVTTFAMTLATNIPTIGFWDKNLWKMSPQAELYYDKLYKAGIIFYNPKEAAQKVNEVYGDIENWWQQELIQEAIKDWTYQYARTDKNWCKKWITALWKL